MVSPAATGPQRKTRRSTAFFRLPLVLEIVIAACLVYEIVAPNIPIKSKLAPYFSLQLLGVGPTVAIVATLGTVLFTRSQYAIVTSPALAGHSDGWAADNGHSVWTVSMYNAGSGLARVINSQFRVAVGEEFAHLYNADGVMKYLNRKVVVQDTPRFVREISLGYPFKPLTDPEKGIELFRLDATTARQIREFTYILDFVDPLGDRYTWTRDFAKVFHLRTPTS